MPEPVSLRAVYKSYIALLNIIPMAPEDVFRAFLTTPTVIHNGKRLDTGQYRNLIANARVGMPQMQFEIEWLVVDDVAGMVAARIIIEGAVGSGGEWLGTKMPIIEGDDGSASMGSDGDQRGFYVRVYENAMYRFEGDKIAEVKTVTDLDNLRKGDEDEDEIKREE